MKIKNLNTPLHSCYKNYLLQIVTMLFLFIHCTAFGQSSKQNLNAALKVEILIIKKSDAPHTSKVHVYQLKAVNTSVKDISFSLTGTNINCVGKKNSGMDIKVYQGNPENTDLLSSTSPMITVPAGSSVEFYVKLTRPANTLLNTWNCTEVKAIGQNNLILSEGAIIESFIPDPADFR
ncbi:MAG: hypothetical protein JWN78_3083 [Bacteroidota bacterium]|nr:hypothetical protein [Bacteroidota bacterium]